MAKLLSMLRLTMRERIFVKKPSFRLGKWVNRYSVTMASRIASPRYSKRSLLILLFSAVTMDADLWTSAILKRSKLVGFRLNSFLSRWSKSFSSALNLEFWVVLEKILNTTDYSVYFLKITDELCPPKPNVLLNATLTLRFCALLKVRLTLGSISCLLYTSDAADDLHCVDLGGRRIITKKKNKQQINIPVASENTFYNP